MKTVLTLIVASGILALASCTPVPSTQEGSQLQQYRVDNLKHPTQFY